ncbi:MAG: hypothetical protein H6817_10625 [Phycisphaerales bacterium]|nr:hypothetical protein [Phycisphaerales bacterium]
MSLKSSAVLSLIAMFALAFCGCSQRKSCASCAPCASALKSVAPTPHADKSERAIDYRRYPVDGRGFSPVGKFLASAEPVVDDAEGSLNPYVLRVIEAYPTDGSYPYHCKPLEYDIYNGVTEDIWYQGRVVAKAYPDGSRCSYCCGLTFEIFCRAMELRNRAKGLQPDAFNGMCFTDLFNLLQLWYIEGKGDSPQRGIVAYGLGRAIEDWEEAKAGDFCDFSRNNKTGHSVIFLEWTRDDAGKITGMKYFSSNSKGVGPQTEYFSDTGGKLLRKWVRLARVGSIDAYKPFNRLDIPQRQAYAPTQPGRS